MTLPASNSPLFHRLAGQPGELPDIVLEAGGLGSSDDWRHVENLLARHARVLVYDRAGMGDSPADAAGFGADAVTARLAALLDRLQWNRPVLLVGYSLGGLYARHFAASQPQRVAGLVLVDATPVAHVFPVAAMRHAQRVIWLLHWVARLGPAGLLQRLFGRKTDAARFRRQLAQLSAPDYLPRMRGELAAMTGVLSEVGRIAAAPRHPVAAVLAGTPPAQMTDADFAHMQTLHRELASVSPAPLSQLAVVEGAHHSSLVGDPAHAAQVAEHILAFARSLPRTPEHP
ncbi:alpha/beta fold hydrolase [Solimonas sp. K1W22B-7]|uniref:alpha/beta fold hydrolase n=1 Tax=Solimonas sp. K1W22B-7 TaxID=2303331 RepID=UPI000E3353D3|nr:alpha/beta fold hydrolase [Solimonas sp. K1W22B-7]AXQ30036.1 alpha/beta fold hydrolase [Solimonas sp. K1W22B-7]